MLPRKAGPPDARLVHHQHVKKKPGCAVTRAELERGC
jgi:hypothetical protein